MKENVHDDGWMKEIHSVSSYRRAIAKGSISY